MSSLVRPSVTRLAAATAVAVLTALAALTPQAVAASVGDRSPTVAGTLAPPIPCPKAKAPKVSRPPRPSPPPGNPAHRVVGGARLATPGLVIPPGAPEPPAVTATSWLVADLDTGAVLGACGPHEFATPASVQKLLLVATMLHRLDPKQVVTVTRADLDIKPGSSAVGIVEGGRYTVETLWLGLLLESGNDAANALARLGSGVDAAAGVRMMNEEAEQLGALQTHAVTPSGLDGPGQFTSAYDLALIARACFADPTFRRYTLTERTDIPAQPSLHYKGFQIQNENRLIYEYPGALGGKTGFTDLARHTYVGAAERGGRRLVVTLLGAEPRPLRGWQQGAALLDWGFSLPADVRVGRLVEPGEVTASQAPASPVALPATQAVQAVARPIAGHQWSSTSQLVIGGVAIGVVLAVVVLALAGRRRGDRRTWPNTG